MCGESTEPQEAPAPWWKAYFGDSMIMKLQVGSVIAFAVCAVIIYVAVHVFGFPSSVVQGYFPYADAMMHGVLPYSDKVHVYGGECSWEYPPLAYLFILVPRLFSSSPEVYHVLYMVMAIVFLVIGMRSVSRIAGFFGYSAHAAVAAFVGFMLLMAEFVLDRFDVFPVVICILALEFFLERKYNAAYLLVALGTLTKLFPVIMIPIMVIWHIRRESRTAAPLVPFGLFALVMLVGLLTFSSGIVQIPDYHLARPLEIESLAANILEFVFLAMPSGMYMVFSFGSDNIAGGAAKFVAHYILYFTAVMVVAALALYFARRDRGVSPADMTPVSVMLLALMALILFGPVFSGQYVMWMIPFVLVSLMVDKRGVGIRLYALLLLVAAFTQLQFLVNFCLFPCKETITVLGLALLTVRNLLMLVMMRHITVNSVLPSELK